MNMKRVLSAALALILIICALSGCGTPADENNAGADSPQSDAPMEVQEPEDTAASDIRDNLGDTPLSSFTVDVTLDPGSHSVSVSQRLNYVNSTGGTLDNIYLNIIPEYFASQGGGTDISSVTSDSRSLSLAQVDGTVYELMFPNPLADGGSITIDMDYTVRIPNIENRFGWQEGIYNLGNFLITPSVWENGQWACQPYVDLGDAFYTDLADYAVTIHVPDGWSVAATGRADGSGTYRAERVRDFIFCASDSFKTLEAETDGIQILVYYRDDMLVTAARTMETAKNALTLFNKAFGKYPYPTLSLVLSGLTGGVSGTEYPSLVMVGPEIPLEALDQPGFATEGEQNSYRTELDRTVAHEIAHQWFFGVVGNDQIRYPWLDEGICRFSELMYLDAYPPEEPQAEWTYSLEELLADYNTMVVEEGYGAGTLNRSLYDWIESVPEDYGDVYTLGASLLLAMRELIGTDDFNSALRQYVDEFAWGFVTPEGFWDYWNSVGDFTSLFESYGLK